MQDDKGTILDSTATFEGKLVGSNITLRGRFKGHLQASGVLRIVEGSNIEADIKATRVEIGGTFQGEVRTDSLQLLEQGRASGTFRAKKLSVKEGAKLNGDLEVGDSVQDESSPKSARSTGTPNRSPASGRRRAYSAVWKPARRAGQRKGETWQRKRRKRPRRHKRRQEAPRFCDAGREDDGNRLLLR